MCIVQDTWNCQLWLYFFDFILMNFHFIHTYKPDKSSQADNCRLTFWIKSIFLPYEIFKYLFLFIFVANLNNSWEAYRQKDSNVSWKCCESTTLTKFAKFKCIQTFQVLPRKLKGRVCPSCLPFCHHKWREVVVPAYLFLFLGSMSNFFLCVLSFLPNLKGILPDFE